MLPEEVAPHPPAAPSATDQQPASMPVHFASPQQQQVAPLWHTLVLVGAILGYSFWGAQRMHTAGLDPLAPVHRAADAHASASQGANQGTDPLRLLRYALSGGLELLVVAWVALGLWMRKVPFRSLLGAWPRGLNAIMVESAIAAVFWLSSMTLLLILALGWQAGATAVYHYQTQHQKQTHGSASPAKPLSPEKKQLETVHELMEIAPANGLEIAAWGALCLVVGFSEEIVFRGYLQSQSISLLHRIPLGVLLTSLVFGSAHGYQGLRGMVLISAFGAMFSIITLLRRNLFPGMLAHAWHDFAMGLLLALIRATHMLDKVLASS